jgi:hypothetical protein
MCASAGYCVTGGDVSIVWSTVGFVWGRNAYSRSIMCIRQVHVEEVRCWQR